MIRSAFAIVTAGLLAGATGVAHAQRTTPDFSPDDAVAPISVVEGPGIKVGEGTVLRPVLGVETGFVSNVFYESTDPAASGLLRILAEVGAGSLPPERLAASSPDAVSATEPNQGSFVYRADARLSYDFMLSGNDRINDQGGLGGGLTFRGIVNPMSTWQFYFHEDFARVIRATNFESAEDTNRDVNLLKLALAFRPRGRSLSGLLHYENKIDFFEDTDQRFANRFQNSVGLRIDWQWLPLTRLYSDVSIGYFTGLGNDSSKITSYPLTAVVGIQTAITVKTSVIARLGYTNGFYEAGPNYSAIVAGVDFGYKYSPMGRFTATYAYQHDDSINANFYRDHMIRATFDHHFVPFAVEVQPEIRFRKYSGIMATTGITGPDTRNDLVGAVLTSVRYSFRSWIAGSISYKLTAVDTDYRYTDSGTEIDPSYVRHELLAGVRAAL